MDSTTVFDFTAAIRGVRHDQRWDILRPELEVLFHAPNNYDYARIALQMKTKYGFDAQVTAYRYRFNKWGLRRNVPAQTKDAILRYAATRAGSGKRTAATFGGVVVDAKKLKRHVVSTKDNAYVMSTPYGHSEAQSSVLGSFLPFGLRPFALWNVPFGGALGIHNPLTLASSPPEQITTPSEVDFQTPPASGTSPNVNSPGWNQINAPSPFSSAVIERASSDRLQLFLQGRFGDLTKSMNDHQKRTMSNWLYQFWLFAFKTSKHWGEGLASWDAEALKFSEYEELQFFNTTHPSSRLLAPSSSQTITNYPSNHLLLPTDLCRWSIHVAEEAFEYSSELESDQGDGFHPKESIEFQVRAGLETNSFSTILPHEMPIKPSEISLAIARSPQIVLEEALSFAIMAQNDRGLQDLIRSHKLEEIRTALKNINALHLATSYLNGGKLCCNTFALLLEVLSSDMIRVLVNEHGHTVFDNIMITILRSHSHTPINKIDRSLKRGARYAGIEVDICGRWDADSVCFRSLVAVGQTSLPGSWKHKFCHTSTLAVCHCILLLGVGTNLFRDNSLSGLFLRRCTHCGLKLEMTFLHTLVMVVFELGSGSCEGEDFFGIIACLMFLLRYGADPLRTANISLAALYEDDQMNNQPEGCNHHAMTPLDLIRDLSKARTKSWALALKLGWTLLSLIYDCAETAQARLELLLEESDGDIEAVWHAPSKQHLTSCSGGCLEFLDTGKYNMFPFDTTQALVHLFASVQAELLNYRQCTESDPWLSENFNMAEIVAGFNDDSQPKTGYQCNDLLKPHCVHASSGTDNWFSPAHREEVSKGYYSNMDIWDRTSFIPDPIL